MGTYPQPLPSPEFFAELKKVALRERELESCWTRHLRLFFDIRESSFEPYYWGA
jgi:hypothetical protein